MITVYQGTRSNAEVSGKYHQCVGSSVLEGQVQSFEMDEKLAALGR